MNKNSIKSFLRRVCGFGFSIINPVLKSWIFKQRLALIFKSTDFFVSILENIAREYNRLDRDKDLRERNVRKKRYFNKTLNHIAEQDYDEAIELYKESIANLNGIKRYNLASVSLAVVCLLLIKDGKSKDAKQLLDETKRKLMGFSETFPVKLAEFILRSKKYQDEVKFKQGLSFLKYLPLFDEELDFINNVFGEDLKIKRKSSKPDDKIIDFIYNLWPLKGNYF